MPQAADKSADIWAVGMPAAEVRAADIQAADIWAVGMPAAEAQAADMQAADK